MDFTAVDFETSAYKRASACAVGAVRGRGGVVVDTFYTLLRPPTSREWMFTEVHNITRSMVADAPTFPEIWPDLKAMIGEGPFVAHNIGFDWSVLTKTLAHYRLPAFEVERICTVKLGRKQCPNLGSHKLDVLTDHFGIKLDHHHAASDAHACAELAMRLWG